MGINFQPSPEGSFALPPEGSVPAYPEARDDASPYAKPGPYYTELGPQEEAKFQHWAKSVNQSPSPDYDLRGFWKAMSSGDPAAKRAVDPGSGQLHFPDKWKTPYSVSFSRESMYATSDAPHWVGSNLVDKDGKVVYRSRPPETKGPTAFESDQNIPIHTAQNLPTPPAHPKLKIEDYGVLPKKPVAWRGVPLSQLSPEQAHHAQRLTAAVNDAETISTLAGALVGDIPEESIVDKLGPLAQGDSPEAQRLRTGAKALHYAAQAEMTLLGLAPVLGAPETEFAAARGAYGDALQQAYRYSAEAQAAKAEQFNLYQSILNEARRADGVVDVAKFDELMASERGRSFRESAQQARRLADLSSDWFETAAQRHQDLVPLARVARFSKAVNNATGAAIAVPRAVEGLRDLKEGKRTDAALELAQAALIGGGALVSALKGTPTEELPQFSNWEFRSTYERPAVADRFAHLPGQQRLVLASSTGTPVQDLKVEWPPDMKTGEPVVIDGFHAENSDKITPSARGTFFAPQATPEFGNQILKARVDLKNPLVASDGAAAARQLGDEGLAPRFENLLSGMDAAGRQPSSSTNISDDWFEADNELANLARRAGYDGLIMTAHDDLNPKQVMVTDPRAVQNVQRVGTFNWQTGNVMQVPSARDLGFHSVLQDAVDSRLSQKTTGEQALATLQNTPGVKDAELKWTGLDDFLKSHPSVTKGEIEDYLQNNELQVAEVRKNATPTYMVWRGDFENPDEYGYSMELKPSGTAYTDQGYKIHRIGESQIYRLTVPEGFGGGGNNHSSLSSAMDQANGIWANQSGQRAKFGRYVLPGPHENYREILLTSPGRQNAEYRSPHWDEPNVLVHLRADDRTTADGKRALFVEEVQSDWAQAGKHEGFANEPISLPEGSEIRRATDKDIEAVKARYGLSTTDLKPGQWILVDKLSGAREGLWRAPENLSLDEATQDFVTQESALRKGGIPPMPFAKNWHELAMKRALRLAAEEGYDQLAWTTGTQQAERYDLSKQVKNIGWWPETHELIAWDHHGQIVIEHSNATESNLATYVGKNVAKKLIESKPHVADRFEVGEPAGARLNPEKYKVEKHISGQDLKIGGEWAKNLYDKMIPQYLNKLGKKFGTKVTTAKIPSLETKADLGLHLVPIEGGEYEVQNANGNIVFQAANRETAERYITHPSGSSKLVEVHVLPLTPELKQVALEQGFPLFSQTGQKPVGLNEESPAVSKPETTAHLPIPPELLGPGQTEVSVAAHELGHAVVAEMDGFLPDEVRSHQHPNAKAVNAAALTYVRLPQGWHQLSPLEQAKRALPMLFAGGVAEELAGGPTFSENKGIAGDMRKAESFLQAAGVPREAWAPVAMAIHDATHAQLVPHAEAIKQAAATREAGLPPELMISREKLHGLLNDLGLSKFDTIPGHRAIGVKSGTGRSGWLTAKGYLPSGFSTHEAVALKEGLGKNFKDALANGNVRVKSMPGGATGFELRRDSQVGIERLRDHLATMPMTSRVVLDLHDSKGDIHTHQFDSPGEADQFLSESGGLGLPSSLKSATPDDMDELSQFNKEETVPTPEDTPALAADLLGAIGASELPKNTYVVRDDQDRLEGAMLLGHVGGDVEVVMLAVHPEILEGKREVKGTGTQLLRKAVQVAAAEGKGLRLVSTSVGKGFYKRLGMIEYQPGLFKWTADEVKALVEAAKGMSLPSSKVSVSHGMRQVKTVLEGLPPEHLSAVKRVTGDETGGARYYKGVVHLDAADYRGHDLDPADENTLLHEVGHAVYANLTPEKKKAWNELSQNGASSSLSEASDNNEHFAQIYADYAEEGAAGINKNEPKALNFIRGVFDEPNKFMKLPRGSEKAQVDVKGRARQRSEFKLTTPDASTGFSVGDRVKIKDSSDSLRNAVGTVKGQADDGRIWVKWDGNTGIVPGWRAKELTNDQGTSEGNLEKGRRAGKKVSPTGREAAKVLGGKK